MSDQPFRKLTAFLQHLEHAHIHYTLASHREDAIMVLVTVPGERWEVEFLGDGTVEVERFISNGEMYGEETVHALLRRYADHESVEVV